MFLLIYITVNIKTVL